MTFSRPMTATISYHARDSVVGAVLEFDPAAGLGSCDAEDFERNK